MTTSNTEGQEPKTDNILIAEFMGYRKVRVGYVGTRGKEGESIWQNQNAEWLDYMGIESVGEYGVNVENDEYFKWEDCAYDTSWDWLMPVVEKIESLMPHIKIPEDLEALRNGTHGSEPHIEVLSLSIASKIDEVYKAVVQFIRWYNANQPKP